MLARIHKSMADKDNDQGFTLIELLVVMIIIGILAAIAIPVFLNQRKKAVDASMKSDLRTVAVEMETSFTDNNAYPAVATPATGGVATLTPAVGAATTVTLSNQNVVNGTVPARAGATGTYCLLAVRATGAQAGSQTAWVYISDKGGLQPSGTTVCS
jgi:type IV pilus assembly protein PilA